MEHSVIETLQTRLKDFQTALDYLDNSGNLEILKAQCKKYQKVKTLVYTFKLLIDPTELLEYDANLGNLLLSKPADASEIFQQVVYKITNVLSLLPADLSLSQISVILRLTSIPTFRHFNVIQDVRSLSRVYRNGGFCHLIGPVTGLSAVSRYTQSTCYFCPDEDCEGHQSKHFIRIHTPGASEAQTVRKDFQCSFCLLTLQEEKSSRILSDRIIAEIVPLEAQSSTSNGLQTPRGQAIPVYIRDDLTKVVEIGQLTEVIGTVRKDVSDEKMTWTVEANNIRKIERGVNSSSLLKQIPRNILKLYKDRRSSPWSFGLTLAYLFGGDVCPPGSYFKLKLAILLSLMSQLDRQFKPLHILAIGKDTEILSRLFRLGQTCAEKSSMYTTGVSLTGRVIQDKYQSARYFVEGGVLHLSSDGVCYIGDLNRLKKSAKEQIQSVLSKGKIITDVTSKYTDGLPHQIEQDLRCKLWGLSDPTQHKKTAVSEELFVTAETGNMSKTMLDSFSVLVFTDPGDSWTDEETSLQMAQQVLSSAMMGDNSAAVTSLPISTTDMQLFLHFAIRLKPVMSSDVEKILEGYYLACRKSRSSDSTSVPVSALQTLLSLAYSYAKLSLRSEVTMEDAVMAIKLYEETLTARFGFSVLNVQPVPHITSNILNDCLGPANDKQMKQFHASVLKYCSLASGLEE